MTTSLRDIDPAAFARYMQTKYRQPALLANLKKAAWDRDTVVIAGGEFGRQELAEAAHMLECYQELLAALQEMEDWADQIDDDDSRVPIHVRRMARAAIARATQEV